MNRNEPAQLTHDERLANCHIISERLHRTYGEQVLAIGVYGSMARGTDAPFSDIEMFCVLRNTDEKADECSYEWSMGSWKAEVDVRTADTLLHEAAVVEGEWPLTHGPYFHVLSLYDPEQFFPRLRKTAESVSPMEFKLAIEEVLVGEIMELVGKLRNAGMQDNFAYLPYLAMQMAHNGAMLIGLHNCKRFTTGALVMPEALTMPDRPAGFDQLAELVMSGCLNDPPRTVAVCESFWDGLETWAFKHDYIIHIRRFPF
ncbi:ANT(4')-I family aminoglycoside nucleotidyltransferase [Paenibacillus sp. GCM10012307]|uniref:ANT(4')-I family aminoglycoside nucleotidyltransferase n=1 Tax=Paenibacillus roseus TaxID=2798579 RepID=A0A934IYE0_9BACL|nr:ANT(4')-I family aminoglycoside nucleotidyltransferase [Paenibacillus roseus]MBJ6359969.1 ANT(4')-I family aminoglycoside nucleotidyltransferase [Paenibacillus roseus]